METVAPKRVMQHAVHVPLWERQLLAIKPGSMIGSYAQTVTPSCYKSIGGSSDGTFKVTESTRTPEEYSDVCLFNKRW